MSREPWWQTTVIYQIYPRSFRDTTGNGIGDLPGITEKLEYLTETLGVGAIWISPFYPSPMADFGYDISHYTNVHPMFGTLADFDELLASAHDRKLKVIIDWVPNHSSDQHPWFIESRSSRTNPKRDWYVWHDPKPDGSEPNNWLGSFGGSAWTYDEPTEQYYLHSFLPEQPNLNWRNPEVQEAMFDEVRFWLDRGADGLRVDVAHFVMKDPGFRDNPPVPEDWAEVFKSHGAAYDSQLHIHDKGHADNHLLYRDLRALLDSYSPERYSVGEIHIADWDEWASYYGEELDELHMPYNFMLVHSPWQADEIATRIAALEAAIPPGAWPNYVLGNHDDTRLASRIGRHQARTAAMLLLTLRGTPTIYYGDELAMLEVEIAPEDQLDPWGRNTPGAGRDGCRTPMQWDASANAGFAPAGATPWLPLNEDWRESNVANQLDDPASILNLYRALLAYRKESAPLLLGSYDRLDSPSGSFLYRRSHENATVLVALNFTAEPLTAELPTEGTVVLTTEPGEIAAARPCMVELRPYEGVIIEAT
ncbi:MAG: alpha-amylase family glycosyl hydrolase [Acidimicrobiia bacterium]|nr:alpha-amylase family glycosyl hydrolase [Acidimicrobiia bacterium]